MSQVSHLRWIDLGTAHDSEIDVNAHLLNGESVPHDHDFLELAVIVDGDGWHETIYGRRRLGRGDALVVQPGAWHAFHKCMRLQVVNCCFNAQMRERELLWAARDPSLRVLLWPGISAGAGVISVRLSPEALGASNVQLECLQEPPDRDSYSYQVAHLVLLLRCLATQLDSTQATGAARFATAPAAVVEALDLLASDIARNWTVADVAAAVSISPTHLSRLFTSVVGRPPMAHLSRLRAEAAAVRLLRGNDSISSIGTAVGWGDPNYFARRFRAHFGLTPTAYRRRRPGRGPE